MKATIFFWAFEDFEKITGYKDRQEIPYHDIFSIAQEIFSKGLNVMIYHNTIEDNVTLYVHDKRFSQYG